MALADLNLEGTSCLVLDPDASLRFALRKRLANWGAEVVEAESAVQGLAELTGAREAGAPFHLVFVASELAPPSAVELAALFRPDAAELERTILMLDAAQIVEGVARARTLGVGAYVAKPLSRPAIIGAISAVLSHEAARDESGFRLKLKRTRILLADDSPEVAAITRAAIEGPDHQVDVAPDGGAAINLFRLGEYDLVLMDIQMPNFDGYAATHEIRAWEAQNQLKRTPVIALTGHAKQEDAQKSFRAGLDGHLVKPIDQEKLLSVIGRYLKRK